MKNKLTTVKWKPGDKPRLGKTDLSRVKNTKRISHDVDNMPLSKKQLHQLEPTRKKVRVVSSRVCVVHPLEHVHKRHSGLTHKVI